MRMEEDEKLAGLVLSKVAMRRIVLSKVVMRDCAVEGGDDDESEKMRMKEDEKVTRQKEGSRGVIKGLDELGCCRLRHTHGHRQRSTVLSPLR
jgi:hypothetical protein